MAKKKIPKKSKQVNPPVQNEENALPVNFVEVGEHSAEGKGIYIAQPVYKAIHRFTRGKTTNESGGLLVGEVIEEFGKMNILINGFVEAKYCEATPTTLKFTHETWEFCHKEIAKKYPAQKIVGWIHTHPDYGIFLSEYDKFIQNNFFREDHQIAYVIDPIQGSEGFYYNSGENLEKCRSFYIFDKIGAKINIGSQQSETEEELPFSPKDIVIAALVIVVVFLTFFTGGLRRRIEMLEQNLKQMEFDVGVAKMLLYEYNKKFEEIVNSDSGKPEPEAP
jgi:proteasome lid subunit RPN8/RPN11